jgi:hypothetical protein
MPNRKNLRAGSYTFCLFGFRPYDLREMAFAERVKNARSHDSEGSTP